MRFPVAEGVFLVKGIIFTEFLSMLETDYSPALLEDLIEEAHLPSGGAYTAVGTYDHKEMLALLGVLSRRTGLSTADLLRRYGEFLFSRFVALYPGFFKNITSAFGFLAQIEHYIHREVRKLYTDVQLPTFAVEHHNPKRFSMVYISDRPLADLCEGLIIGCLKHFGEEATLLRTDLSEWSGTRVRFELRKAEAAA
jgi:Haem-NO-binding